MYCPECGVEYREGFTECSDCGVALVDGAPPELPDVAAPAEWAPVFDSAEPVAISFAKATLEDAGIPFLTPGEEFGLPKCQIQVPPDREAEARALLEPLGEATEARG
jgi:hypothetical protein